VPADFECFEEMMDFKLGVKKFLAIKRAEVESKNNMIINF